MFVTPQKRSCRSRSCRPAAAIGQRDLRSAGRGLGRDGADQPAAASVAVPFSRNEFPCSVSHVRCFETFCWLVPAASASCCTVAGPVPRPVKDPGWISDQSAAVRPVARPADLRERRDVLDVCRRWVKARDLSARLPRTAGTSGRSGVDERSDGDQRGHEDGGAPGECKWCIRGLISSLRRPVAPIGSHKSSVTTLRFVRFNQRQASVSLFVSV